MENLEGSEDCAVMDGVFRSCCDDTRCIAGGLTEVVNTCCVGRFGDGAAGDDAPRSCGGDAPGTASVLRGAPDDDGLQLSLCTLPGAPTPAPKVEGFGDGLAGDNSRREDAAMGAAVSRGATDEDDFRLSLWDSLWSATPALGVIEGRRVERFGDEPAGEDPPRSRREDAPCTAIVPRGELDGGKGRDSKRGTADDDDLRLSLCTSPGAPTPAPKVEGFGDGLAGREDASWGAAISNGELEGGRGKDSEC